MKKVLSTYKILLDKVCNFDIDESWTSWAQEMIEAGYESDNLYILAGMSKPFNQFEMQELTSKVLSDLKIEYSDKEQVIHNYIYYLIFNSVNKPETYLESLRELKDIYYYLNMDSRYSNFYLLYFAKDDLNDSEVQWYWEGATRLNINDIIKEEFTKWLDEFEQEQNN